MMAHGRDQLEFGDFQTPLSLARKVCKLIASNGFQPVSVMEPTCGIGNFIQASLETFPNTSRVIGLEINPEYVFQARRTLQNAFPGRSVEIYQSNFFHVDGEKIIEALPAPILIIGNPPWVTNTDLSARESRNLPYKVNLDNLRGIDALMGKSNFDISEWIIRKNLEWLNRTSGVLAMLCKTTVARKALAYAWKNALRIKRAQLYRLDTRHSFGVSADACLLLVEVAEQGNVYECQVFPSLDASSPEATFGFEDGRLVADLDLYRKWKGLAGNNKQWRSGIKHDNHRVFELHFENGKLLNGFGEIVDIEPEVLFPLAKSSDLMSHRSPQKWMLVPQQSLQDTPAHLQRRAPKAWQYLLDHASLLEKRRSAVYRKRHPFSVFGIGRYSFSPYKIAISGFSKRLDFVLLSPFSGRPIVLDDTCYFLPCDSSEICTALYEIVNSKPAIEFWSSLLFWDSKRPITTQILDSLDLASVAQILGKDEKLLMILKNLPLIDNTRQQELFN